MGKKTRLRNCPAAGQTITAVECGAGRHTTYACPEQCPFNPFSAANYAQYLELERSADAKLFHWILDHVPNPAEFEAKMRRVIGEAPNIDYFRALAWHGFYRVGPEGETVIGRWAKEGFPGLTGDERTLMRCRLQIRLALLEVHRVLDDKRIEAVDLLDPEGRAVVVADRGFAAQAVRFGVYLADVTPLPNFWRLFGTCVSFPKMDPLEPLEVLCEVVRHLGGPSDSTRWRGWLVEHFNEFYEALTAVALARRRAMFEHLDAQFGKAVYELAEPFDKARARLDALPQVAKDDLADSERKEGFVEARVWFAEHTDPEHERLGPAATLGRVLLGSTHWRLEVMGAVRLDRLRERFEAWMEQRVCFAGERRDDIGARMRAQEPKYDAKLVPPALMREPPQLLTAFSRVTATEAHTSPEEITAECLRQQQRKWLNLPVPALEGKTPREAASIPALRPKLVALLKSRICSLDTQNLETGRTEDLNWMLRELGLDEILFEPPPPRPPLRSDEEPEFPADVGALSPPPLLPPHPWTRAEAKERLEQSMRSFSTMTQGLEYFAGMDYAVFGNLQEVIGNLLEADEFEFLLPILSVLVLCFAPRGTRPPEISAGDLRAALAKDLLDFESLSGEDLPQKALERCRRGRQPELVNLLLSLLAMITEQAPKKARPRPVASLIQMIVLKVLSDELDRVLRGRP